MIEVEADVLASQEQLTPLIEKYQRILAENPKSLAFAPLAECYRKLGLGEQASELLRTGLRHNPHYLLGHLTMAELVFDQGNFQLAYTILKPFIESNRDNLKLMRLFGKTCYQLEHFEEALQAYKYILFLTPKDTEAAAVVRKLEESEQSLTKEEPIARAQLFDLESLNTSPDFEWVQKDFSQHNPDEEDLDSWSMESSEQGQGFTPELAQQDKTPEQDRVYQVAGPETASDREEVEAPLITHTLVDLYMRQGYLDRACELLEKILELNPDDQKTREKYNALQVTLRQAKGMEEDSREEVSEDEGRERLMQLIPDKVKLEDEDIELASEKNDKSQEIAQRLWAFHKQLKDRAVSYLK